MVLSKYGENMDQRTHHLLVISNAAKMNYLSVRVSRTKRNKKRGWAEGGAKEGGGGRDNCMQRIISGGKQRTTDLEQFSVDRYTHRPRRRD